MRSILLALAVLALLLQSGSALAADTPPAAPAEEQKLDAGDTAWVLMSTGLVLLMVPGLALFYGGMVRRKNLLGTMMHSMMALAIVGIQWLLLGYALVFGDSVGGFIGWKTDFVGLQGVLSNQLFPGTGIPIYVHCMFQGMFAIITPALISGAVAERIRFGPYCLFILLWATVVYAPLAHWVWAVDGQGNPAGWLGKMNAIDFAGGTAVHIAAGMSGLAAILVLRKRAGYPQQVLHPSSMVLTLTGAGLLWFGWFGFNGGSALHSNGLAAAAVTASQAAAAGAALSWAVAEWLHRGKPTALGFASGLVAGLVAVTPASGYVTPLAALSIGLVAGVVCYGMVCLKPFLKYDDSLDAFGIHGVGGFLGAVLTGVLASATLFKAGSGADLPATNVVIQLTAALVAAGYAFVLTLILVKGIDLLWGFCLDARAESEGLDRCEHGEAGFDFGPSVELALDSPQEPRPATVPPLAGGQKRFTVVVDGPVNGELMHAWSALCQAGSEPPAEFRAVYPYVTTVQGNRFRFRGGNPEDMSAHLQHLFQKRLKNLSIRTYVEA